MNIKNFIIVIFPYRNFGADRYFSSAQPFSITSLTCPFLCKLPKKLPSTYLRWKVCPKIELALTIADVKYGN